MRIAIIDIGTNTFHLVISEVHQKNYTILFKKKFFVTIGKHTFIENFISEKTQEKIIKKVSKFKEYISQYKVDKIVANATSALRTAHNGQIIAEQIETQTGIPITIISGKKEAALIYKGVKASIHFQSNPSLIMDLGGGSVEFIICNDRHVFWTQSFEIGTQRLVNKFDQDPIEAQTITALHTLLSSTLHTFFQAIIEYKPKHFIGSSGIFDTLLKIGKHSGSMRKDNTVLSLPLFKEIYQKIVVKNHIERLQIPGMTKTHVDMIVVSCIIIQYVTQHMHIDSIEYVPAALRLGLLLDTIEQL